MNVFSSIVPRLRVLVVVLGVLAVSAWRPALAQLPPPPAGVQTRLIEGVDFSVIDHAGNAGFRSNERPDWYPVQGRGSVSYDYGLARTEVTTAQWMEFVNTFSVLGGDYTQFGQPIRWGARLDSSYTGPGWRWELDPNRAQSAEVPVWGLSWRQSAMYCNWLHNGRSSDPASITQGAYSISTFGYPGNDFNNGFTDQITRSPGARFWIPNLDEWIKGTFYDAAQGRWWLSHYGSDTAPIYGFPGEPGAQSSAGLPLDPEGSVFYIPLTAYGTQSPFGLLSTSGGTDEWLEDAVGPSVSMGLPTYRWFYQDGLDSSIFRTGLSGELPHTGFSQSIRIAAAVPAPGAAVPFASLAWLVVQRRRRP